jgi:regulator of sigma E protease
MSLVYGLAAFAAAILLIVLVHELGHLVAAKWARMPASVFSIGFGPRICGFQWGETEYRLSAIPLGGYVRIDPMEQTVSGPHGPMSRFDTYPLHQRALVISAGVIMNLLLALGLYLAIPLIWGAEKEEPLRVATVDVSGLPVGAERWSELPADASVASVNGERIDDIQDLYLAVAGSLPGAARVTLDDGRALDLPIPTGDDAKLALAKSLLPAHAPVVGTVVPGTPAGRAGFRPWDRIVSVDGRVIHSWESWRRLVQASPGRALHVAVLREGEGHVLELVPVTAADGLGAAGLGRGIERAPVGLVGAGAFARRRFAGTIDLVRDSWRILFTGRLSVRQVSGPVTVVETTVRVFQTGWEPFLAFVAFLSINIAAVNFLPIPALDGGYFALLGLEAVRRRPLPHRVQAYLGRVGILWLCMIMAGTLINDLLRLTGR